MRMLAVFSLAVGPWLYMTQAVAAPGQQPPMNSFNSAFYTCSEGGAFSVSYNSERPTEATITTSNNNHKYDLKRTQVAGGVQFSNDTVKFWTDGKAVVLEGTAMPYRECKIKVG